ncbi:MAG: hypothetical protein QM765_44105 [Myxococcales bacterium]
MTELGRMRLRAFVVLAGMFLVGAFAGAGLVRYLGAPNSPMPPRPPGMELFHRLGLTPEQEAKTKAVFEKHRPEARCHRPGDDAARARRAGGHRPRARPRS